MSHLGYSLVQAAGQVVSSPRHAAHNVGEVSLTLCRVCAYRGNFYINSEENNIALSRYLVGI